MSLGKIGLIDYRMGNLHSVSKALSRAGAEVVVSESPDGFDGCSGLVLPGVGNFGDAMARLREKKFDVFIADWIAAKKPFLGICLGLQVLFDESEEAPGVKGLGIFPGCVRKFPDAIGDDEMIVPSMGWNSINVKKSEEIFGKSGERFYFVHSYYADPADKSLTAAEADYGVKYCAAIVNAPLYAMQFHPEKSGNAGLELLKRFVLNVE